MASQTVLCNETKTLFCVFDVFLYENRFQGDLQNLMSFLQVWFGLGVYCHFQQYFSYIVAVSFMGGETKVPGENNRPVTNH